MAVKRNGSGFSEEHQPYKADVSATTSPTTPSSVDNPYNLTHRERADVGIYRIQNEAYSAIRALWARRSAEGMTKKDLAEKLGRDPAWVTRTLAGPGNWTLRTLGELSECLAGDVAIVATALEDLPRDGEDIYDRIAREAGKASAQKPLSGS